MSAVACAVCLDLVLDTVAFTLGEGNELKNTSHVYARPRQADPARGVVALHGTARRGVRREREQRRRLEHKGEAALELLRPRRVGSERLAVRLGVAVGPVRRRRDVQRQSPPTTSLNTFPYESAKVWMRHRYQSSAM